MMLTLPLAAYSIHNVPRMRHIRGLSSHHAVALLPLAAHGSSNRLHMQHTKSNAPVAAWCTCAAVAALALAIHGAQQPHTYTCSAHPVYMISNNQCTCCRLVCLCRYCGLALAVYGIFETPHMQHSNCLQLTT
jgi:hypothetical protein